MSQKTKGLLAMLGAALIWSTAGAVTKILLGSISLYQIGFWRFFIASIILLPLFLKQKGVNFNQLIRFTIPVSLFSVFNILLFYFGISKTTANATQIIYSAVPLVAAILAHLWIQEKLTASKLSGLLIGFFGVIIIVLLPIYYSGQYMYGNLTGNLLIAIAVMVWSIYTVGSRLVLTQKSISPIGLTSISVFLNLLAFVLLIMMRGESVLTPNLNLQIWALLLYLSLFVTVVTFMLFQVALQYLSSAVVSVKQYLELMLGIGFNFILLGEKLNLGYFLGSVLILIGVYLVTKSGVKPLLATVSRLFKGKSRK